ncbi:MAG: hypothetical protein ACOX8E_10405 [Ruminococcus sp.]|jgi:hypothetical protein
MVKEEKYYYKGVMDITSPFILTVSGNVICDGSYYHERKNFQSVITLNFLTPWPTAELVLPADKFYSLKLSIYCARRWYRPKSLIILCVTAQILKDMPTVSVSGHAQKQIYPELPSESSDGMAPEDPGR